jgi:hypothetical protein
MRETSTCRLAVSGQVARPVSEPGQQGVAGELAEALPVAGQGDAPAGQVDVIQGELADGLGAGGVHGR